MTERFVQTKNMLSFDKRFSTSIGNDYFLCHDVTVVYLTLVTFVKSLSNLNH